MYIQSYSYSTQITANEKKQNDEISRSNAEQRRSFYSIEPPTQLSEEILSNPPNSEEEVARLVADYDKRKSIQESQRYKVSRPSSASLEIFDLPDHPAIALSTKSASSVMIRSKCSSIPPVSQAKGFSTPLPTQSASNAITSRSPARHSFWI